MFKEVEKPNLTIHDIICKEKLDFFELPENKKILLRHAYSNDEVRIASLIDVGELINTYIKKFNISNDLEAVSEIAAYIGYLKMSVENQLSESSVKQIKDNPKKTNGVVLKKKVKNQKLSTIGASAKIIKVDPNKKRKKSLKKK